MTNPEAVVVRALTSFGVTRDVIAREFGVSESMIGYIRRGEYHKTVRPDLTRWRNCKQCGHWEGKCTMGFPEAAQIATDADLLRVATECSAYIK
jgi:hypothetical protein